MYTVKSESDEGVYYLVNGWDRHSAFWKRPADFLDSMKFRRAQDAKMSLTKLLKIMPDYATDTFTLIEV